MYCSQCGKRLKPGEICSCRMETRNKEEDDFFSFWNQERSVTADEDATRKDGTFRRLWNTIKEMRLLIPTLFLNQEEGLKEAWIFSTIPVGFGFGILYLLLCFISCFSFFGSASAALAITGLFLLIKIGSAFLCIVFEKGDLPGFLRCLSLFFIGSLYESLVFVLFFLLPPQQVFLSLVLSLTALVIFSSSAKNTIKSLCHESKKGKALSVYITFLFILIISLFIRAYCI